MCVCLSHRRYMLISLLYPKKSLMNDHWRPMTTSISTLSEMEEKFREIKFSTVNYRDEVGERSSSYLSTSIKIE